MQRFAAEMSAAEQHFLRAWKAKLSAREEDQSLRKLLVYEQGVDFFSNDYLGLARACQVPAAGPQGATGSRLISGNSNLHESLEQDLAHYFASEAALLYNSGYDANLGLLSCMADRSDTIIYDEHAHASMRDGLRLSPSRSFSFKNNNLESLEQKLTAATGKVFVVVEALYSMTGDLAPLQDINSLCEQYQACLVVDEAHSFGYYTKGLCHELGMDLSQIVRIVTFGKALGYHGAVVLGSEVLKQYLINFSRSFIYTTAMPLSSVQHLQHLLQLYQSEGTERRKALHENIACFKNALNKDLNNTHCLGPIQMLHIPDRAALSTLQNKLLGKGLLVKSIFYPTVPKNSEGIRVCLHSFNSTEDIKTLSHIINTFNT